MSVYKFIKSAVGSLGIGAGDQAVIQNVNLTPASIYGPRYNVRSSLALQAPAFAKIGNEVVPVSILGTTGLGMQGTFGLNPLANAKG